MRIEYLADNQTHIPMLAEWLHTQFRYLTPAVLVSQRTQKLVESAQKGKVPMTFIALSGDILLGSASLLPCTMTHRHLSPLLADVYVNPGHRRQGIGSRLVVHAVRQAALLGVEKAYLFTHETASFYTRLGWEVFDHADYRGHHYTIMSIGAQAR